MTYLQFLLIFTGAPCVVLVALLRGRVPRSALAAATLLAPAALIYTAPWDNLIVLNKVWSYSRSLILGIVVGVIPVEEYLFYILQVIVTILFCVWLQRHVSGKA